MTSRSFFFANCFLNLKSCSNLSLFCFLTSYHRAGRRSDILQGQPQRPRGWQHSISPDNAQRSGASLFC